MINSYNFLEVVNQDTGHMKVVTELTDELFDTGYRFLQYIPNSRVDLPEVDAQREEDLLERMANSSNDPCYWSKHHVEGGKCASDLASDPIYHAPLEIY
jgi:hypothetical protein